MTKSNHQYSIHHHHEHHVYDADEFRQSSMKALRRKKILPKILFAFLLLVTAFVCLFVVWAYTN